MFQYSSPTIYQKSSKHGSGRYLNPDRDTLITAHLPKVKYIADRIAAKLPPSIERDDLYGAGVIGLIDAVERYDASRGVAFTTFAEIRVRGAIMDNLRALDWASRSTRRRAREVQSVFAELEQIKGRAVTEEEVALHMNIPVTDLREILQDLRGLSLLNLDEEEKESGLSLLETVSDDAASPLERYEEAERRQMLAEAVGKLPERERQVVALYYVEELNMKEIGKVLDVTESRVSQLRTQAIVRLRAALTNKMEDNKEELLTNEEMSALLPDREETAGERAAGKKRIVPYNFRRPDRLSKEQVRSLYLLHDLFAHSLSSSLPLYLRAFSEVSLISVEQQSYSEYLRSLRDPTNIFTIYIERLRGMFAVELNSSIAFPIIDRMLGGSGQEQTEQRTATELELKILEGFLSIITENYREAWKPLIEFDTEITGRETRPQLLQIAPPNEVVIAAIYQIQIGETRGMMSICLPVMILEDIIEKFNQSSYAPSAPTPPEATQALLKTLSTINFPVSVELEKVAAKVSDLMSLTEGDILRTNHRLEKPVNINVSTETKFAGQLAALKGRMIIQLTETKLPNRTTVNP